MEKLENHWAGREGRGLDMLHTGLLGRLPTVSLSPDRPRKNPLFIVDLVLDSSGVHYSTPLENFETSLLNLFDKGILSTHAVPQLEKVGHSSRPKASAGLAAWGYPATGQWD